MKKYNYVSVRRILFFLCVWTVLSPVILASSTIEHINVKQPLFWDDSDLDSLKLAIANSLNYFRKIPSERQFEFCGQTYSAAWLMESLQTFESLLGHSHTKEELDRSIREQFTVCPAGDAEDAGEMLVTGYFEPIYKGSLKKTSEYGCPLYTAPPDLAVMAGGSDFRGRQTGRLDKGRFVPYWTREEIEKNGLLVGHELVYLRDPIEAFIMHVQGSGRIRLQDGSIRRAQYAAKNGRPYRSIGRLLADEGKMRLNEVSLPAIVRYLKEHPEDQQRIFHHNESFVFFKWGNDSDTGPLGCLGEPLTAGRSVALDHKYFPSGILCFLQSQKPAVDNKERVTSWLPMSRFVLNQDAGSAIQGAGRLDFFWGSGQYAETAAGLMKHPGKLYLLVKKK